MPATVVVGGQFGSEGKGKVAYWLAREQSAVAAVRVGGSNSGHTVVTPDGQRFVLRHLPTAAVLPGVQCIIGPGAYIDVDVLESEIARTRLNPSRLHIDPNATIITSKHKAREVDRALSDRIGSTQSGTGEAVADRVRRGANVMLAGHDARLAPYTRHGPVRTRLRKLMLQERRVIVEGTQGFGLSVLHAQNYPKATSRDTTAAAAVAEAALSPRDVDEVVLVLRAFPIRVAGDSGPLPRETTWARIAAAGGWPDDALAEYTSVTGRLRRVAEFDPTVARAAIEVNAPDTIVVNHLDYLDADEAQQGQLGPRGLALLDTIESGLEQPVDWIGLDAHGLRSTTLASQHVRVDEELAG